MVGNRPFCNLLRPTHSRPSALAASVVGVGIVVPSIEARREDASIASLNQNEAKNVDSFTGIG